MEKIVGGERESTQQNDGGQYLFALALNPVDP